MMGKDYDLIVFVRTKHNNLGENVDFWKKNAFQIVYLFLQFRKIENSPIKTKNVCIGSFPDKFKFELFFLEIVTNLCIKESTKVSNKRIDTF